MKNQDKKRILIFSLAYYPHSVGGAEVAVKEITKRVKSDQNNYEIEFDMITLGSDFMQGEKNGNIKVFGLGGLFKKVLGINYFKVGKYFFPFLAFLKVVQLNRKYKYDAVWSIMASYAGISAVLFKIFNPKVKFILTLQEGDSFFELKRKLISFVYKMVLKKADVIQAISNYLADWAKQNGSRCPVFIIPNGVDFDNFSQVYNQVDLEKLKKDLKKEPDDIFLITASRLVQKNAIKDVIESLKYLSENIKFLILGEGDQKNNLLELVSKLNLSNRVIFAGFIPHKDLPKYFNVSDIFVRPSLSEGFGNSFIEAMAAGVPVIATPVGGIVDFLKNDETGLFCEVGNPKNIAQKVEKLIKDKESRDYIIQNAKKMAEEKYDWKIIAKEMVDKVF